MGIDWEEILDAEGEDMAEAYDDTIPYDEAELASEDYYDAKGESDEKSDGCKDNLTIPEDYDGKDQVRKEEAKSDEIPILAFGDDELSEEDLELFK